MSSARVEIRLEAVEHNARVLVQRLGLRGIEVYGVTKGVGGGVVGLADARLDNLRRLREHGITAPFMLLRSPLPSQLDDTVAIADVSVNTEAAVLDGLSAAAAARPRRRSEHGVLLMVELGDLREGVLPAELHALVERATELPGLRLAGVGTNLGCYGGVVPSARHMQLLATLARSIRTVGIPFDVVSAGGSNVLALIDDGLAPVEVNQVRFGESILLGTDAVTGRPLERLRQDGFRLFAEVIEVKDKPSVPLGRTASGAFGEARIIDRGVRRRALVAVGEQDLHVRGLTPERPGVITLGASSDHTVLDVHEADPPVRVGEEIAFRMGYAALATAMTSRGLARKVVAPP